MKYKNGEMKQEESHSSKMKEEYWMKYHVKMKEW